ncbi:uncharacterized protein LOC123956905 isoform X2 [Micropterus dolomieu]|uniref:uncharacterized protein LOC123956905 isoform X2 n=1 Tax=Micropterus dolomieu TaxID=147949 RepID=UPI001E8CA271|nr:uncharacterized protein LOC123956905 isoform X2 [Micropterus dolomieu]
MSRRLTDMIMFLEMTRSWIRARDLSGISMMTTQSATSELFFVSLVVLLVVLIVLLVLCCILKRSRNRNLTELKISGGRPTRTLTIRAELDHAYQLLDHLLDRLFLKVEPGTESGDELEEEIREEPGDELGDEAQGERRSYSALDPKLSTAASLPSRAVNTLQNKLWKWITVATPPSAPPSPPPANQDQTDDDSSHNASCSYLKEEQHDKSKL